MVYVRVDIVLANFFRGREKKALANVGPNGEPWPHH